MKKIFISILIISTLFGPYTNFVYAQNNERDALIKAGLREITSAAGTCVALSLLPEAEKMVRSVTTDLGSSFIYTIKKLLSSSAGIDLGGVQQVEDQKARERLNSILSKETCWDSLAKGAANVALEIWIKEAVNYINTGFDGNPLYIRNIDDFMQSVTNQQLNIMLPELDESHPIFGNTLRVILTDQVKLTNSGINPTINNTKLGKEYNDFMEDFTKGGWGAFLNNMNNPLSAIFNASNNVNSRISNIKTNLNNEISRNNGYLDVRKCIQYQDNDNNKECLRYETITPGSLVAEQAALVFGTGIRQIEMADEVNEVISLFIKRLVDKLFEKNQGLFNLGSSGNGNQYGGTGYGSNLLLDGFGNPILSINNLRSIASPVGFTNYQVERPQQLREVIVAQKNYYNISQDSLNEAYDILPLLAELDYCIPGPNPLWQSDIGNGNIANNFKKMIQDGLTGTYMYFVDSSGPFLSGNVTPMDYMTFEGVQSLWSRTRNGTTRSTMTFKDFMGIDSVDSSAKKITLQKGFTNLLPATTEVLIPGACHVQRTSTCGGTDHRINLRFPIIIYIGYTHLINSAEAGDWISNNVLAYLSDEIERLYSKEKIVNAFANISSDPSNSHAIRGTASRAYDKAAMLIPYAQTLNQIESERRDLDEELLYNIALLEDIHKEAQDIVKVAKARYIAERESAGDPVNLQCIDMAYQIDESPINATYNRVTTGTPQDKETIKTLNRNRIYFDSTL